MVTEEILRHSPFCGCSQVIAAFGAALEVATANTKWQALAAQSNFDTARMVLTRLKRLWPVAEVFEGELLFFACMIVMMLTVCVVPGELDKCHGAVHGALQVW